MLGFVVVPDAATAAAEPGTAFVEAAGFCWTTLLMLGGALKTFGAPGRINLPGGAPGGGGNGGGGARTLGGIRTPRKIEFIAEEMFIDHGLMARSSFLIFLLGLAAKNAGGGGGGGKRVGAERKRKSLKS